MKREIVELPSENEITDAMRIENSMVVVFDNGLWEVVEKALKDKKGSTVFVESDQKCMTNYFNDVCPGFVVKDVTTASNRRKGEVSTRLTVPESWREVYEKKHRDIDDDRVLYGMFYDFACAAANLYGAVSKDDLAEIADYWWNDARWIRFGCPDDATPEERKEACRLFANSAMDFVESRQQSPFAVAYMGEDNSLAVSFDKYPPKELGERRPNALSNMLQRRKGKERWFPATFDDFMMWASKDERDWPDEYADLKLFILKTWHFDLDDEGERNDLEYAMEEAHDALASGLMWNGAVDAMRSYIDFSTLSQEKTTELRTILCKCANATRQDANWAFTPNESMKKNALGGEFDMNAIPTRFSSDLNVPITRSAIKVGRNDPCPCGSGKKFKKCCMVD